MAKNEQYYGAKRMLEILGASGPSQMCWAPLTGGSLGPMEPSPGALS